jgi:hypothetical protein
LDQRAFFKFFCGIFDALEARKKIAHSESYGENHRMSKAPEGVEEIFCRSCRSFGFMRTKTHG